MGNHFCVTFSNGQTAAAIKVGKPADLADALSLIGLEKPHPILVVVGGASNISEESFQAIKKLFVQVLAPLVESLGAFVIDGGTDAGVMRLMGEARTEVGATFPLIGVAPEEKVMISNYTNVPPDFTPLEPHHTHFVIIPGSNWGDESPWIAQVASVLADVDPSVTILLNGGEITFCDAFHSVTERRLVMVVAGSGRTADKLASALRGEPITDARCRTLADSGLLQKIDLMDSFDDLTQVLKGLLSKPNHK